MIRVNIFSTSPNSDTLPDFVHDDKIFSFGRIGADGLSTLVDGELWIFVDWIIPELSGLEMCRRLRADSQTELAHITMVLDRNDDGDRKRALHAGADDYVVGPVDRQMMLDRVLALQGDRTIRNAWKSIELGRLKIESEAHQARWDGKPIPLSPNEFRLLRFMAENRNRVLSREAIIGALGKEEELSDVRTVDVWMKRLRQGFKTVGADHLMRTVHKQGYVLDVTE